MKRKGRSGGEPAKRARSGEGLGLVAEGSNKHLLFKHYGFNMIFYNI
jgi:hypothetical protein